MITRIEIDGFKSFRQFHLNLEPFQVIVGLNAAGKSNLLDAFRFISKVITSDEKTAYQELWAATGELFTVLPDGRATDLISIGLEFLVAVEPPETEDVTDHQYTRVRYEISIRRVEGVVGPELTIANERLIGIQADDDEWAAGRAGPAWEKFFRQVYRPSMVIPMKVRFGVGSAVQKRVIRTAKKGTVLGRYRGLSPVLEAVFNELEQTTFLNLETEAIRTPVSAQGPSQLKENGAYLPNVLARLQLQDEFLLADVSADLSNLVSGLIRVEVEKDEALGHHLVWVHTSEGKRFSLRELSDGTLRLLVLTTLRNDPDQYGTLLLEEPENGVHPFRVKLLSKLLRSMASDVSEPPRKAERLRQVIATTHSPALVSQLENHEIVFAHTADVSLEGHDKPVRITRMSSLDTAASAAQKAFARREMLRYLDESDLEIRSKRLKGEKP